MSVSSSVAVLDPDLLLATPRKFDLTADSSFDSRWGAWIEDGRQHELAAKRNLHVALLGIAGVGLVALALFFGLAEGAR